MTKSEISNIYRTIINFITDLRTKPVESDLLLQMTMFNSNNKCIKADVFDLICEKTKKEMKENSSQFIDELYDFYIEEEVELLTFVVRSGSRIYSTTECTCCEEVDDFLKELRKLFFEGRNIEKKGLITVLIYFAECEDMEMFGITESINEKVVNNIYRKKEIPDLIERITRDYNNSCIMKNNQNRRIERLFQIDDNYENKE